MSLQRGVQRLDPLLQVTEALPDDDAVVVSDPLDLQQNATGSFVANVEYELLTPALTAEQLPDTLTVTYDVITSENSDMSDPTVLAASLIVQTGAGGAGAASGSQRFRVPSNVQRYVAVRATGSVGEIPGEGEEDPPIAIAVAASEESFTVRQVA